VSFATVDLSAVYFDILKDRLYTAAPASAARRSAQTAIYKLAHTLARLAAPVLSFTCEEVWTLLPKSAGDPASVHLALFPAPEELTAGLSAEQRGRLANWDRLMDVRPVVLKALEQARQEKFIGNPLEARVVLAVNGEMGKLLAGYRPQLPALFIVSQVDLREGTGEGIEVQVERAPGAKCERCWKYTTDVGQSPRWPTICAPCVEAVEEIQRGG
jgi:isoleucyl-tRNA synthetase